MIKLLFKLIYCFGHLGVKIIKKIVIFIKSLVNGKTKSQSAGLVSNMVLFFFSR